LNASRRTCRGAGVGVIAQNRASSISENGRSNISRGGGGGFGDAGGGGLLSRFPAASSSEPSPATTRARPFARARSRSAFHPARLRLIARAPIAKHRRSG